MIKNLKGTKSQVVGIGKLILKGCDSHTVFYWQVQKWSMISGFNKEWEKWKGSLQNLTHLHCLVLLVRFGHTKLVSIDARGGLQQLFTLHSNIGSLVDLVNQQLTIQHIWKHFILSLVVKETVVWMWNSTSIWWVNVLSFF